MKRGMHTVLIKSKKSIVAVADIILLSQGPDRPANEVTAMVGIALGLLSNQV